MRRVLCLFILLCFFNSFSAELKAQIYHKTTLRLSGKQAMLFGHFDKNQDGVLGPDEKALYKTYLKYHYPLVTKEGQKAYDMNHDLMLEPAEEERYLEDVRKGIVKSYGVKYRGKVVGQK